MSKRKLLLADDSVTVQKVVNLAFESEDIEIIAANDGMSAFEKFVEFSPDLVMADINLPGADGYEICERIKQDDSTKHIPVLLLVGSFAPFSEEKAARVGASGFLKKPFQSINLLIDKVTELIGKNEAEDSAEAGFNEADTKPFPVNQESADSRSISDDFGETGMDDEMIQTERGADYSFADETAKYEISTELDIDAETEDSGKTRPMTSVEIEELGLMEQDEETVYELADEPDDYLSAATSRFNEEFGENTETESSKTTGESSANPANSYEEYAAYEQTKAPQTESFPAPEAASALELDTFDLLELPPLHTVNETVSTNAPAVDETPPQNFTTVDSEIETVQPDTAQTTTDYSDYAETTAEDSSISQSAHSLETRAGYYSPPDESETDSDESEIQPQIPEESSETAGAETAEFAENYYSPESETKTSEDYSVIEEQEEISTSDSEELTTQDFTDEEIQPEITSETQALITQETNQEISKTSDSKVVVHYLPPEVIDEIAERVVEKLAEKLRR